MQLSLWAMLMSSCDQTLRAEGPCVHRQRLLAWGMAAKGLLATAIIWSLGAFLPGTDGVLMLLTSLQIATVVICALDYYLGLARIDEATWPSGGMMAAGAENLHDMLAKLRACETQIPYRLRRSWVSMLERCESLAAWEHALKYLPEYQEFGRAVTFLTQAIATSSDNDQQQVDIKTAIDILENKTKLLLAICVLSRRGATASRPMVNKITEI